MDEPGRGLKSINGQKKKKAGLHKLLLSSLLAWRRQSRKNPCPSFPPQLYLLAESSSFRSSGGLVGRSSPQAVAGGRLQLTRELQPFEPQQAIKQTTSSDLCISSRHPNSIFLLHHRTPHRTAASSHPSSPNPPEAMAAMFSQNPTLNGPNYSLSDVSRTTAPEGAREHRFDP